MSDAAGIIVYVAIKLFFRRLVGSLASFLFPNYSTCHHCGRPWNICNGHSTPYTEQGGSACFPLCETCWSELKPQERLPYYRKLIDSWMSYGDDNHNGQSWDNLWDILSKNVLAGR